MTIIVSVLGRKGGIGKTTLAKNIGAAAALQGYKTVVIDADSQGNAASGMRVQPWDGFKALVLDDAEWDDVLTPVPTEFTGKPVDYLAVLPAFNQQLQVEKNDDAPPLIYSRMNELRGVMDVVVCDLPPGISNTHVGLYYASDYVILPTLLEIDSVKSLETTVGYLDSARVAGEQAGYNVAEVLGIVPNRFAASERVHQVNSGYVRGVWEKRFHVFQPMRDLAVWRRAAQFEMSIYALSEKGVYAERVEARKAIMELGEITSAIFSKIESGADA
jgi:cellulose biosynthesis protein BcsQ